MSVKRRRSKAVLGRSSAEEMAIDALSTGIMAAMARLKLTKSALARKMDRPESDISRVVDGRNMTLSTLGRYAEAMGQRLVISFVDAGPKTRRGRSRTEL